MYFYQIFHRDMSIYEPCLLQPTDQSLSIVCLWYKVFMSQALVGASSTKTNDMWVTRGLTGTW